MAKKTVTVTLELDGVEEDDFGDKWTDYRFKGATATSAIEPEGLSAIAERWAQSDSYWVDFCSSLLEVIEQAKPTASD